MYYELYRDEDEAIRKMAAKVNNVREDYDLTIDAVRDLEAGHITPCDRARLTGRTIRGVSFSSTGPFSRSGEPDRGEASYDHGYAWEVKS